MSTLQSTADTSNARRQHGGNRPPADLARLFGALPPNAVEAEASLLGSILIEPPVLGDVVQIVPGADDFFKPAHGAIFQAMVDLYDQRGTLDIVQLHQMLIDRSALEDVGGEQYLVDLADAVPTAAHATHYAMLVREKAMLRQLISAAGEILQEAYTSPDKARRILDGAEKRIFNIAEATERSEIAPLSKLIHDAMAQLEANEGRHITGVPTGYSKLDEMTSGLQNGELIIIAARPSMGKTALALNLAEQIAMQGSGVGFFSLEMSQQQLVNRMLCARAGIDSQRFRRNMLRSDDYRALMAACGDLEEAPIYIDDTPGMTVLQLRAKARRMVHNFGVKIIVVDYLQLLTAGGRVESRQIEVSEISRSIKALARELEIPVICLSQLNRAAEQRDGHRPRMSDLRESGSIEQDADVISMLHREEYYHRHNPEWIDENPDKVGVAELIIAKQRNGPTGTVMLTWSEQTTRFADYSPLSPPGDYYESSAHSAPFDGNLAAQRREFNAPQSAPPPHASPSIDDDDDDLPPF